MAWGRGVGTALLEASLAFAEKLVVSEVAGHVDGSDEGAKAFARKHGFAEIDRQVEQVRTIGEETERAENGLTVVRRAWRGRGLASALKTRQLTWAAASVALSRPRAFVRRLRARAGGGDEREGGRTAEARGRQLRAYPRCGVLTNGSDSCMEPAALHSAGLSRRGRLPACSRQRRLGRGRILPPRPGHLALKEA